MSNRCLLCYTTQQPSEISGRTAPRKKHCVPVTPQLPVHLPSLHLPPFLSPHDESALKDREPTAEAVSVHAEPKARQQSA